MNSEFAGLTAIITGAGSGIGLEVAKGLKARGATIYGFDINEVIEEFLNETPNLIL